MKTMKLFPILGCVWMLTMASTCSSDDDNAPIIPIQNTNIGLVNTTVQQGNWRITYFYDTDHEETSNFSNYTFTFASGGVLTAVGSGNNYNGTWSVTDSHNSNDDNPHNSDDVDFNIAFSSPSNFTELSDDWEIVTYTSTRIELIDVSGGNGGTDHLVFEKN